MASTLSYKITLSNNKTEKQGIDFLLSQDPSFLLPTKEGRKQIFDILKLNKKYARAFDLFQLPGHVNTENEITVEDSKNITLIELKTTQKYLPNNPKGFFFGATQNEFDLAEQLGNQYMFCFVSLHQDSKSYSLETLQELNARIVNKRTQFQINL
jgi:hypothetical protein